MEKDFSKKIHRNSYANVALRILSIIGGLILFKLNIAYLGVSLYGLWATIASVSSWANIADLGISNGLRNELTKSIASNDSKKQKSLIRTAVIMLSGLSLIILLVLTGITELFFLLNIMDSVLRYPMYITNVFFCLSFVMGISRTIAYSYQYSWLASFAQTCTVIMQIIGVVILLSLSIAPNLILFAIVNGLGTILGNLIIIIVLFGYVKKCIPKGGHGCFVKSYQKDILNVGFVFFLLQLSGLILYATDNVIINKLFNSVFVTKYNVITTIYNTICSLFALLLISLWSAVTYAAEKNEFSWIRTEISRLKKIWLGFATFVLAVSVLFNQIVAIWLGPEAMHYEVELIVLFAVYSLINSFGSIYINVANGLGRLKLQIVFSISGAVINIPLSIFLASTCGLGLLGIKMATLLCCIWAWTLVPYDISKFIKQRIPKYEE